MNKIFQIIFFITPCFSFAQVDLDSTNLPIIIINTNGNSIEDEPKITADMGIIYNEQGQMNYITDPFNDYDGKIGIELRGSTSQFLFDKKQYAFETRDLAGENNNVSLVDLPTENDWILHAPFSDKTLIRNALTYKLAGQIMDYAPRFRFCELIINDDYLGVYLLLEKIKRDNDRVDISRLDPDENEGDDLTGGYILKLDKFNGNINDGFVSDYTPGPDFTQEVYYQYHYPKPVNISDQQKDYIENFIQEFEDVMDSDQFNDPIEGYTKYIDPTTFVDYMLINELTKNVDAYRISTFLYKDRDSIDGRLKMGPVWDFNLGYGNVDFCMGPDIDAWVLDYSDYCPGDNYLPPFYWEKLRSDTVFQIQAKLRWLELRSGVLSNDSIMACIDVLTNEIDQAKNRNFERWPIQDEYIWPNAYVGGNYENDLEYLKDWLVARIDWLDGQFDLIDSIPYYSNLYFEPLVFPNPFVDEITFQYYVRNTEAVTILIYNAQGQLVANLQDVDHSNGLGSINWNNPTSNTGLLFYSIYYNENKIKSGSILRNK